MDKIDSVVLLKEAILELELKRAEQGRILKEQFQIIKENLRPSNIIQNTFNEVATSPKLRSNLMGALFGLAAGYFSKKLVAGKNGSPIRRIIGNVLQVGITAMIAKKPYLLQTIGQTILKRVFTKNNSYEPHHQRN